MIVVDNASCDGSGREVEAGFPEVQLIVSPRNLGYGGGNNLGIEASRGRFLLFLNPDTVVEPRWVEALVRTAEADDAVGMCASKVLNYHARDLIDSTGLLLSRDCMGRGRGRLERDRGQFERAEPVFMPSGCAGLYRRTMVEQIGGFDARLHMYVDDVDIGLRGRLAGWSCVYVPDAVVYHRFSSSMGPANPWKYFYLERNRIWVVLKCLPWPLVLASVGATLSRYVWLLRARLDPGPGASAPGGSTSADSTSSRGSVALLLRSYLAAIPGVPHALRARRAFRRERTAPTEEVRSWFTRFGITNRALALQPWNLAAVPRDPDEPGRQPPAASHGSSGSRSSSR